MPQVQNETDFLGEAQLDGRKDRQNHWDTDLVGIGPNPGNEVRERGYFGRRTPIEASQAWVR